MDHCGSKFAASRAREKQCTKVSEGSWKGSERGARDRPSVVRVSQEGGPSLKSWLEVPLVSFISSVDWGQSWPLGPSAFPDL